MIRLCSLFRTSDPAPLAAIPDGERVYAVGDIHGRRDLLTVLANAIDADEAARGPARTTVVLLGDLVDRGPDSAGVIAFARAWQQRRHVRILAGNHEEMFVDSFSNEGVLREFLRHGGRETVLSYGIDPQAYTQADLPETQRLMERHIPQGDRDFLAGLEDIIAIGDYLFVHAGVRPDVPLDQQRTGDLRWIRGAFLDHTASFGPTVVHGHTIFAKPDVRHNRIGIDTGAYSSGRLTALGLEGTARWLIETQVTDDAISVTQRSIS